MNAYDQDISSPSFLPSLLLVTVLDSDAEGEIEGQSTGV